MSVLARVDQARVYISTDSGATWIPWGGTAGGGGSTSSSATLTNVSSSATSVTILSSNASRKGAIVYNDSTQVLFLKFGSTASSSSFTYRLGPGETWEMASIVVYTGVIDGIWAAANGNARVTEL